MDFTQYTSAKNHFASTPNLCDLFKLLSIETWKRLEYTYLKPGVKVFETTLTQNLLFTINAYNDQYKLGIDIFEALNEKVNGNDFELIIKYPKQNVELYMPIQAKKIYRNERYDSMDHGDQIESLMKYADKHKTTAFYLLYNFVAPLKKKNLFVGPIELMGCTLVPAKYLYDNYYNKRTKVKDDHSKVMAWQIPNFYDLNPGEVIRWHDLVCADNIIDVLQKLQTKKDIPEEDRPEEVRALPVPSGTQNNGVFPIDTVGSEEGWININAITKDKSLAEVPRNYVLSPFSFDQGVPKKKNPEKLYPDFAPKSRIVITKRE